MSRRAGPRREPLTRSTGRPGRGSTHSPRRSREPNGTRNPNTNVSALSAQRNLETSGINLNKALQRLSSGLRVNSASDDAAGLAISTRLGAQIRGLNQAIRNQ